jgi:hypothetical protein
MAQFPDVARACSAVEEVLKSSSGPRIRELFIARARLLFNGTLKNVWNYWTTKWFKP